MTLPLSLLPEAHDTDMNILETHSRKALLHPTHITQAAESEKCSKCLQQHMYMINSILVDCATF